MKAIQRVLIMAGGTGGHVFPGLALADYFRGQGIEVEWLGTSTGLEARVVPEAAIHLHTLTVSGLRRKGWRGWVLAPLTLFRAFRQATMIIKQFNPDIVIGMGGFASGPGGVASWYLRIPLVIHEQNAHAGLTNRLLARVATKVLTGFPGAFKESDKVVVVGNPVRAEIEALPEPSARFNRPKAPLRLLVLGGSLGARAINEVLPRALAQLDKAERPEVWHQTGEKLFAETKKQYESLSVEVNLIPFVSDMAAVYSWADVVLCRAGALTVAELCAVGLGAVFVPYPHAVDDHQTANAQFMVNRQAAICIQQSELTDERLAGIVRAFVQSPDNVLKMAKAAYQLRNAAVTGKIYEICKEIGR